MGQSSLTSSTSSEEFPSLEWATPTDKCCNLESAPPDSMPTSDQIPPSHRSNRERLITQGVAGSNPAPATTEIALHTSMTGITAKVLSDEGSCTDAASLRRPV